MLSLMRKTKTLLYEEIPWKMSTCTPWEWNHLLITFSELVASNSFKMILRLYFFKSVSISRKKMMSKLSIEQTKTKFEFKHIFTLVDISVMNIDTIYKIKQDKTK